MLNEILVGRYNQLLTRLLNITGGAPAPQLAAEVMPVLVLVADSPGLAFLKSELLLSFGVDSTGAVPLKLAYIQVANPPGSGGLIEIESYTICNVSAATVDIRACHTTISTKAAQRIQDRDSRINPGVGTAQFGPGRGVFGNDASADGVGGIGNLAPTVRLLAGTSIYMPVAFVLHPGEAFTLAELVGGLAIGGGIYFRFRPALPSEIG